MIPEFYLSIPEADFFFFPVCCIFHKELTLAFLRLCHTCTTLPKLLKQGTTLQHFRLKFTFKPAPFPVIISNNVT